MKVINLDYTYNTRDLVGMIASSNKVIMPNRLIRSGSLHKLSDKDIETLIECNLKVVVDFRSEEEFVSRADVRIPGVTYISLPVLKTDESQIKNNKNETNADNNLLKLISGENSGKKLLMQTYYDIFTTEKGINAYINFFKIVQENESGAILWHCSQGKDRAGLASFLLEYALGVPYEECVKDYLYTNVAMEKKIKQLTPLVLKMTNGDKSYLKPLKEVFSADIDYLNVTLKVIDDIHGGLDNFLKNVLKVDINLLRKKYLIDSLDKE